MLGQFYYCSRLYMCTACRELCHKTSFNLEFLEGRGVCVCIILIRALFIATCANLQGSFAARVESSG